MTHRKRTSILLVISFVLILVGSFFSNAINTDFGKIKTDRLYLMNDNGYTVSARIYIPKTATQEAPAPAMIICPGGDSPSDLLTPWASEIARRGFVVALVDYTGCGDTEVDNASQYWTNHGAMELETIYDYLANRPFVDATQIGVGGHSMGSLYSYCLSTKRQVSLVISDVIYSEAMPTYNLDFVQISGQHDEGLLARVNKIDELFKDPFLTELFGTDEIEPNKLYGSWEDHNARIFYVVNQTHADDMYWGQFVRLVVDSAMNSMEAPNPLPVRNMIYGWNFVALFVVIIGIVMMLFCVADLLLDSDLFSSLKLPAPQVTAGFAFKSKGWWICAAILALIPALFFFPGTAVGNQMASNKLFQLGTTPNGFLIWSLFAACGMLVFFLAYHFMYGKKKGCNVSSYGLATGSDTKVHIGYIVKSAVFALILFMLGYFVLMLIYRYADTDVHGLSVSFRLLNDAKCATMPWYCLGMLPYFLLVTLAGNTLQFRGDVSKGKDMTKSVILGACIGMVGMLLLFIFYEVTLRLNRPFYTGHFAHFYMLLLSNVLLQFCVASGLAIFIRRKTNSIWPGVFIGTALVAFGMVSSNSIAMII